MTILKIIRINFPQTTVTVTVLKCFELEFIRGRKRHININKFAGLSRDSVGARQKFVYVFLSGQSLGVPKCCVPKTLAFAFGLRLRSKTRCFKTRVLGRRLPNGKPQERLRFRDMRSKTLAFKNAMRSLFAFAI